MEPSSKLQFRALLTTFGPAFHFSEMHWFLKIQFKSQQQQYCVKKTKRTNSDTLEALQH